MTYLLCILVPMGCNNSAEASRRSQRCATRPDSGRPGFSSTGFYRGDATASTVCNNRLALAKAASHPTFRYTVSDCDLANLASGSAAASTTPETSCTGCATSTTSGCDFGTCSRGGSGVVGVSTSASGGRVTVPTVQQQLSMTAWNDDPYADGREIVVLTAQQKRVIVGNWRLLKMDLIGRGSRIFQLIFARNPRVRALFACGHLDQDQMVKDPRFIAHATRFMQARF